MNRDFKVISEMLSYRRPAGSKSEAEFIARFLAPLDVQVDKHKNTFKVIKGADGAAPTILWSSHTDSVHHSPGRQKLVYDEATGNLQLPATSTSSCLGADCAAGVWVMTEMIKASVPGLYVFHWSEEIGCVGSGDIVSKSPAFLNGIKAAIAFDRKGTDNVITHMGGQRTCSDAFAQSLAAQLPGYRPDDTGSLTDTKMYRALVPECTNLSVGYEGAHTSFEQLNVHHLIALRDMMLNIDATKFVIERDPAQAVLSLWDSPKPRRRGFKRTLEDIVWSYPGEVAKALESMGIDADGLSAILKEQKKTRAERRKAANNPDDVPDLDAVA